jgi:hypothetical protein
MWAASQPKIMLQLFAPLLDALGFGVFFEENLLAEQALPDKVHAGMMTAAPEGAAATVLPQRLWAPTSYTEALMERTKAGLRPPFWVCRSLDPSA